MVKDNISPMPKNIQKQNIQPIEKAGHVVVCIAAKAVDDNKNICLHNKIRTLQKQL